MSISLQLYRLRDTFFTDMAGTLATVREIGLEQVEAFAFDRVPTEYRAALDAAGLSAASGHAGLVDAEDVARTLDAAAEVGIGLLIDPMVPAARWARAEDVARTAERLNEVAALAAPMGIEVGYHNHSWETSTLLDGRHALEVLADSLAPQVRLEVDAYWASVGGADTPALLRRLGERVAALHIKNGVVPAEPPVIPEAMEEVMAVIGPITRAQKPAGEGDIDLEAVLAAAPQDTIKVIELDDYDGDVLDAVRASYAWLSERGA
ncbi:MULTISPECIES: sugar phosphate isomerase/epimerase [unclassified Actinomyces]|uniref:sugar phosphate isomerase/epimerase family protein n=1 Tax=unclassified Actinomyces TaxID=2609248 RepID=UPI002017E459|nr:MULTISPECIES: sugar phosphate isomerase/epimerase [unclassified Actinomyces]MCL3777434.1 sugar phosphate isomerase/epimerase [Actinomyces sp. AC-20-1]MCL3789749.1 sugar phosphate isomerase/epimerase [Actinomyces sp. 187325]MCL3792113.1 sugar phosphate isomerase/epimerase [Actinomyces sp. 186855]MCL3794803.1 sugar phosphate isomerase/epimerase [Actinomyces sp. 217892]